MKALHSAAMAACLLFPVQSAVADPLANTVPFTDPLFSWHGLYVGLNAGSGMGRTNETGSATTLETNGLSGGVLLGGNYSRDGFFIGGEMDYQVSDVVHRQPAGGGVSAEMGITALGTLRARGGADFGQTLGYVTAGLALGENTYRFVNQGNTVIADSDWAWGWAAGVGVETQILEGLSLKAEYLYVDLGNSQFDIMGWDIDSEAHFIRAGLNFHF